MSTRKLIGKVSATEKNPSSCDEFQFWKKDQMGDGAVQLSLMDDSDIVFEDQ